MNKISKISLIIVVVIALVSSFAFLYYMDIVSPVVADMTQQTPVVNNITTHTQVVQDTTTWQTYKNTEYGFEIKIPADWSVNGEEGSSGLQFYSANTLRVMNQNKMRCTTGKGPCNPEGNYINLYFTNIDDYTNKDFVEKSTHVDIGSHTWLRYIQDDEIGNINYLYKQNGKIYIFGKLDSSPIIEDVLKKILSTFMILK